MKMIQLFFAASRQSRVIFRTCFGRWIENWQETSLLNGMIEVKEGANPPATNLEHDLRSLLSRFKYVKTDPGAGRLDKLKQTASASWA